MDTDALLVTLRRELSRPGYYAATMVYDDGETVTHVGWYSTSGLQLAEDLAHGTRGASVTVERVA